MASLRSIARPAVVVLLFAAGGCVPASITSRPAYTGRVVDPSGQPIAGASISFVTAKDVPLKEIYSETNGRFNRRADTSFEFLPLVPVCLGSPGLFVSASQAGRSSQSKDCPHPVQVRYLGWGKIDSFDLGDLVIAPVAEP